MTEEENLKELPITIETARKFFNKRQMSFIIKLYKNVYKEGFLNGCMIKDKV
jgi:glycosylphosphatidylinositol transamidase (GPIT) subunit GPI8